MVENGKNTTGRTKALFDLVLRDEFLNVCKDTWSCFWKRERIQKRILDMAQLAS